MQKAAGREIYAIFGSYTCPAKHRRKAIISVQVIACKGPPPSLNEPATSTLGALFTKSSSTKSKNSAMYVQSWQHVTIVYDTSVNIIIGHHSWFELWSNAAKLKWTHCHRHIGPGTADIKYWLWFLALRIPHYSQQTKRKNLWPIPDTHSRKSKETSARIKIPKREVYKLDDIGNMGARM